jgi:hypothetical protein
MSQPIDLKSFLLKMITEEKESLTAYKSLCAKYKIEQNPIPEAIMNAKIEAWEMTIKALR